MRKKIWTNKKFAKRVYKGFYRKDRDGEREFVLRTDKPKKHNVTFESHEAAKALGWQSR